MLILSVAAHSRRLPLLSVYRRQSHGRYGQHGLQMLSECARSHPRPPLTSVWSSSTDRLLLQRQPFHCELSIILCQHRRQSHPRLARDDRRCSNKTRHLHDCSVERPESGSSSADRQIEVGEIVEVDVVSSSCMGEITNQDQLAPNQTPATRASMLCAQCFHWSFAPQLQCGLLTSQQVAARSAAASLAARQMVQCRGVSMHGPEYSNIGGGQFIDRSLQWRCLI